MNFKNFIRLIESEYQEGVYILTLESIVIQKCHTLDVFDVNLLLAKSPVTIGFPVCVVADPTILAALHVLKQLVTQQLGERPPLLGIADEALGDEVFQLGGPVAGDGWHVELDDGVEQGVESVLEVAVVRWLCLDQLVCEAAERPHVDLLRVLHAPSDLGRDPGRCSLLTHSILRLF